MMKDHSPFGEGRGQIISEPVPGEPGSASSWQLGAAKTARGFQKSCEEFPYSTMLE